MKKLGKTLIQVQYGASIVVCSHVIAHDRLRGIRAIRTEIITDGH
ncbi:MAG: hypothetical protein ACLTDI_13205 [Acutalibacteraceae bacterium]